MKTIIASLMLLSTLCTLNVQAQEIKKISIWLKKDTLQAKDIDKIRLGDLYQVTVNDIDLNLYKITVNNVDSTTQTALTFPGYGTFDITKLTELVKTLTEFGGIASVIGLKEDSAGLTKILMDKDFLFTKEKYGNYPKFSDKEKDELAPIDRAHAEIGTFERLIDLKYETLVVQKDSIDEIKLNAQKTQLSYMVKDKKSATHASLYQSLKISDILKKTKALRNNLNSINKQLLTDYNQYSMNVRNLRPTILPDPGLKKRDSLVRIAYVEFSKVLEKAKASLSDSIVISMVKPLIALENNNVMSYSTLPLQFSKDQTTLTITATPFDGNYLPSYKSIFTFPLKSNTFIGVSNGFFVSTLHDEAFSVVSNVSGTDTTYTLINEHPGKFEFGTNAMLRYGSRICKSLFWHTGVGPAIAITDKIKPRLLFGGGLAFGQKHKFLIDLGGSIGNVDRLSKAYTLDTPYALSPTNVKVSQFSIGGYLSLGYIFNL